MRWSWQPYTCSRYSSLYAAVRVATPDMLGHRAGSGMLRHAQPSGMLGHAWTCSLGHRACSGMLSHRAYAHSCSGMLGHRAYSLMLGHAQACSGMLSHRACSGMLGHRACSDMLGHARTCSGMLGHASEAFLTESQKDGQTNKLLLCIVGDRVDILRTVSAHVMTITFAARFGVSGSGKKAHDIVTIWCCI